jgi:hypothetical protein
MKLWIILPAILIITLGFVAYNNTTNDSGSLNLNDFGVQYAHAQEQSGIICEDGSAPSIPVGIFGQKLCEEAVLDPNAGVLLCATNFCQCPEGFHNGDLLEGENFCIKDTVQQSFIDAITTWINNLLFKLLGDFLNPFSIADTTP